MKPAGGVRREGRIEARHNIGCMWGAMNEAQFRRDMGACEELPTP
jgi:hypothetical protein